jgi:hypothetical protein
MSKSNWLGNMRFKDYFISEAARGLKDLVFSDNSPNFRIQVAEGGINIRLYVKTPKGMNYAGGLNSSECFDDTKTLSGYKLFAWHSEVNDEANGFGPFLYDIAMEVASVRGGYLVSHYLVNRLHKLHLKDDGTLDPDWESKKGWWGGDPTDDAERVYKYYYYNRKDVESVDPESADVPPNPDKKYMYQMYRKQPVNLKAMIDLNKQNKIVLVDGLNQPIMNINLNTHRETSESASQSYQPKMLVLSSRGRTININVNTQIGKNSLEQSIGDDAKYFSSNQFSVKKEKDGWYLVPSTSAINQTIVNGSVISSSTKIQLKDQIGIVGKSGKQVMPLTVTGV